MAFAAISLGRLRASTNIAAVFVAEVDDAIHPISAELMVSAIDGADAAGAAALVFVLRTPGGVLDSTRAIISRMIAARTPVIVYVAPSGARAASAGFLITIAADVAAMAPATHIGAAHPVSASGQAIDKTMGDKVASDVAAFARSLAQARQRNVSLAEEAVTKSRSFTEREALEASPPLVDLVAGSLDELIAKLDGRTIHRFSGAQQTLHTAGARRQSVEMTWRQRFLSTLAHPQIAYLLFTLGLLGLTVELWNPGTALPGIVGGVCLLLAFLAFQVLPINVAGLLLIALGVGLLVLELKFPTFGALGVGGVVEPDPGIDRPDGRHTRLARGPVADRADDARVRCDLPVPRAPGPRVATAAAGLWSRGHVARRGARAHRSHARSGRAGLGARRNLVGDRVGARRRWSPVHVVGLRGLTLLVEPGPPAGKEGHPT